MQARDANRRLMDIVEAMAHIESYITGVSYEQFLGDSLRVDAVLWRLTVIGEAAGFVSPETKLQHTDIPWAGMRGMRNALIHEYYAVDLDIVWRTVSLSIPALRPRVESLIS